MSAAYALQYYDGYDEPERAPHPRWGARATDDYRVLGYDTANNPSTQTRAHQVRPTAAQLPSYSEWQAWQEYVDAGATMEPFDDYAPPVIAADRTTRLVARRLVLGSVALMLLAAGIGAVLLASPALARSWSSVRESGATLSGYRDLSLGTQPGKEDVPVIDVRSAPPDAAPAQQKAPASAPPGSYTLLAAPSTSVQQIEKVLSQYGSPAAGLGQQLYDLGVKYGIDPAYALAFFVHESACGTRGVARSTKSLGNIRWTAGYDNYQGYRSYPTWESGMEDWYKLVTETYIGQWHLTTVDAIVPVYAPWGDSNSPPTYAAAVKSMVDSWRGK